ncbi:hypothetical protein OFL57_30185 [Pseudomonas aeruginosa]|jgi:hypothetical protein|uniref:hypothetical protein n=1 Tax=Pseudomonas aeruginosa TaxID=287 RepID=UPI00071BA798|nr:hypothetical protein [Pseudomonas aeruginosa]KSE84596.1 hypothetical protein AO926_13800 [Pseudomonas aeruginosa]KSI27682.1 hypothetical protein AO987_13985 [Pseudomonas aeruginosa]MBG7251634.1 hypothetical protein [Pseudomonas aeruginosa]MBH8864116.1 hypothetical protein [Pseudomonas aeruginosa]MCL8375667.1 hypothetical protein [Pseudomonas aeruginosa]
MSGSGGSYLGPSTPTNSCETLQFDTQLASPKAPVVGQLSVGDILDIAFAATGHQVVIALWSGAEAGGIVHSLLTQLRNCMTQGEQFQARVLQINGGQVRVRVYHA